LINGNKKKNPVNYLENAVSLEKIRSLKMDSCEKESIYEKVMREHRNKDKVLPIPLHELNTIEKIIDVLKHLPLTIEQRDVYEEKLKILRDEESILETARMKAMEKGIMEGRKKAEVKIARKSLEMGLSEEIIRDVTGLTEEEIIKLKSEIHS